MDGLDIKLVVSIISVFVTILTTLIIKPWTDKKIHIYKLRADYADVERRKVKDVLGVYKIRLIESCESLSHRLWNFKREYNGRWKTVEKYDRNDYYTQSFVYRILNLLSWIKIIERELIYFDTTIADKEDLDLIKYLRVIKEAFLYYHPGLIDVKDNRWKMLRVHVYRNDLEKLSAILIDENNSVIGFDKFQQLYRNDTSKYLPLLKFLNNLNPKEKTDAWLRLQVLHVTMISFLNSFGYDYHYFDSKLIHKSVYFPDFNMKYLDIIRNLYRKNRLSENNEFRRLLLILKWQYFWKR